MKLKRAWYIEVSFNYPHPKRISASYHPMYKAPSSPPQCQETNTLLLSPFILLSPPHATSTPRLSNLRNHRFSRTTKAPKKASGILEDTKIMDDMTKNCCRHPNLISYAVRTNCSSIEIRDPIPRAHASCRK